MCRGNTINSKAYFEKVKRQDELTQNIKSKIFSTNLFMIQDNSKIVQLNNKAELYRLKWIFLELIKFQNIKFTTHPLDMDSR